MKKRLYRNVEEKWVAGVLAGLSDYFGLDVSIWRVVFIVALIVTGFFPLVIVYLIAWMVIPPLPSQGETVIHDA